MPELSLIYPMLAMVLLTFAVAMVLFRARVRAVREGHTPITYFRTFQGAEEPEFLIKATRHFANLFEVPTLFYAGCLAAMVAGVAGPLMVALAWGYVIARLVHAVINIGSNRIRRRMSAYFISWLFLLAFWVALGVTVATRH